MSFPSLKDQQPPLILTHPNPNPNLLHQAQLNRCVRLEAAPSRMISVWHQSTARAIQKDKDPSALLSFSRYFDEMHW